MTAAARKHLLISCGSVSTGSAFRALTAVVGRGQLRVECGGITVYDSTPSVQQKQRLAIEILACRFLDFCAGAQAIPYFCPFRPCLFARTPQGLRQPGPIRAVPQPVCASYARSMERSIK